MKKSLLTITLATSCLLLSNTFAAKDHYKDTGSFKDQAPCPDVPVLMSGVYLGGQVGYDSYRIRENINLGAGNFSANPAVSATGFVGGLFLGYGQYFSEHYYLAGEVLGNYSGASTTWTATNINGGGGSYNNKMTVYSSWGLALLPGFKLNNESLLYIRLGYTWARMQARESTATTSTSTSNWGGGFAYGLGLESLITGNWSVRTELNHINTSTFSSTMGAGTNFSPADNQVMVGLIYHFA